MTATIYQFPCLPAINCGTVGGGLRHGAAPQNLRFELPARAMHQTPVHVPAGVGLAGLVPCFLPTGTAPAHQFALLKGGGVHHGREPATMMPIVSCGACTVISA
jgi:hypothetical protein